MRKGMSPWPKGKQKEVQLCNVYKKGPGSQRVINKWGFLMRLYSGLFSGTPSSLFSLY